MYEVRGMNWSFYDRMNGWMMRDRDFIMGLEQAEKEKSWTRKNLLGD